MASGAPGPGVTAKHPPVHPQDGSHSEERRSPDGSRPGEGTFRTETVALSLGYKSKTLGGLGVLQKY